MNAKTIIQELLEYISSAFYVSSIDDIDLDKSLIQQEVIDSMGLMEIATFVEKRYGLAITEQDLNQTHFGSVNRIANFVLSRTLVEAA